MDRASTTPWPGRRVFLLGDSAIGSPYLQSISLGLGCAFFLAGHIANRALSAEDRQLRARMTHESLLSVWSWNTPYRSGRPSFVNNLGGDHT